MNQIIERLIDHLDASSCNFLAVEEISRRLDQAGFLKLDPADEWTLSRNGKYYMTRNDSAIFAFVVGEKPLASEGLRIIASHSDSPGFKLKPNCEIYQEGGMVSLNVEKYGGPIMYTWFDRPLSLSGRVMLRDDAGDLPVSRLVDLRFPVATIPHLAIHFNRAVNEGNPLSVQRDMIPVVGYFPEKEIDRQKENGGIVRLLIAEHLDINVKDILDYELTLYPAEPAQLIGVGDTLLQSARIDDLSMVFASLEALLSECDHPVAATRIMAVFDNEETGSGTRQGAAAPVLRSIVERILTALGETGQAFHRTLAGSFMISADDAHAWHPNYNTKYDPTNHPVLGGGPVIKINSNCKYMTDAPGAARFRLLCNRAGVPVQYFVNHSDVAGGSTLGNISTSQLDIPGVDVGAPIWAMHSARETGAVADHLYMIEAFRCFYR